MFREIFKGLLYIFPNRIIYILTCVWRLGYRFYGCQVFSYPAIVYVHGTELTNGFNGWGRKAIKSRWVYDLKSDGRYKARLVAKGFSQIEGLDFDQIFSPVVRFESVRTILALAALEGWTVESNPFTNPVSLLSW